MIAKLIICGAFIVAKPLFRKQPFRNSASFLYLFGVKNAIFCKFLDKLSVLRIASELSLRSLIEILYLRFCFTNPLALAACKCKHLHARLLVALIFKKLHLLFAFSAILAAPRHSKQASSALDLHNICHSKMEVQGKNGVENHQLTHSQPLACGEYWLHLGIVSKLSLLSVCTTFVQMGSCTFWSAK